MSHLPEIIMEARDSRKKDSYGARQSHNLAVLIIMKRRRKGRL